MLKRFILDEGGQDLVEYTLLLAFVALAATALLTTMQESIATIWGNADARLGEAADASAS